jgi:antiviral helicase SKI2
MSSYADLLEKIIHPDPTNAAELLAELGLDGIPTPEQVHEEIEQKLLLPPKRFPDHWLPYYQT